MKNILPASVESLESRRLMSGSLTADQSRLIFSDVKDAMPAPAQLVHVTNTSDSDVPLAGAVAISGADAAEFQLDPTQVLPDVVASGDSVDIGVIFNASRIGPAGATLQMGTGDAETDVTLRGLGTLGLYGNLEPSLQWILDTYQIPVTVGDSNPANNILDMPPKGPNDEVLMPLLEKAGDGPVTVDPIAAYTNPSTPLFTFGFYTFGDSALQMNDTFTLPATDAQTINPHLIGTDSFDPGSSPFGLYTSWPNYNNRISYSEDFRNTWQPDPIQKRTMRFYPLKDSDGTSVPNAFVVGVEEATNHDYQDAVYIVRNVRVAQPSESPTSLSAVVKTAREVDLKWTDKSFNESGFVIERSPVGGTFTAVATTDANVTTFHDLTAQPSTRYVYRVRAAGDDGVSGPTNPVTVTTPSRGVIYQAEAADLTGAIVQNTSTGFTGTGYAAFQNASGDSVHFGVTVFQPGTYTLQFRYANGGKTGRPLALNVNGTIVRPKLSFPITGSWSTWWTISVAVTLQAGNNDITLSTIGSGGGLLDALTVR